MMRFCTVVNCMDGRVQVPVAQYLQDRFNVDYVDVVSEAGPNAALATGAESAVIASIERRVRISVEHHRSVGIAIVGHHDCAGNPSPELEQRQHTMAAVRRLQSWFKQVPVIGLWVDDKWEVSEVENTGARAKR